MTSHLKLSYLFKNVLDHDEEILWSGQPNRRIYVFRKCFDTKIWILGVCWGIWALFLFTTMVKDEGGLPSSPIFYELLLGQLIPFSLSILFTIYLIVSHRNLSYALTDKRLIIRSGIFGIDYTDIDFESITYTYVAINFLENKYGVGTISIFTARDREKDARLFYKLYGLHKPYEVSKMISDVSLDIKTDWEFPNVLRPETNPGTRTKYEEE